MKKTIAEIMRIVDGSVLQGSTDTMITGAAGLGDAGEHDISFLGNTKYHNLLRTTKAGAVIVDRKPAIEDSFKPTLILVKRPDVAFAEILHIIDQEHHGPKTGIHPTATIDQTAIVDAHTYIGPHVVVEAGAHIQTGCCIGAGSYIGEQVSMGKGSLVHPRVSVLRGSRIGERVIIHSGSVIGSDGYGFVTVDRRHRKIPQIGNVEIGNDVEIGANVTIDRGTTGATRIGDGTKMDNLVHVAHNVQIGKNCLIIAQVGISGSTIVGDSVTIAGQAGLIGHVTIGDGSIIGAQAGVIGNIP
ncbi:MAG: UDP-3-O-(3-hydroxymyristoyl)glucosamine N-acyltransferase, partial [Elusimicrobia bacterium]|nr:UDP-3-O-(3-hydroxymyristoyl)glucosamine N-acyltransferase [Elusimicrobiota bacterium]MBD3412233.1 UDP-3-O-(3-hydroxymyristoyl)glucosamine N-acyltransferase [Elusimicrobiota bacterium]